MSGMQQQTALAICAVIPAIGATVEAKAVAAQIAPGVLVKVEGVEGNSEAGLEVAQQGVDPVELC